MDNCVVCLTPDVDVFFRINIGPSKCEEFNIQRIIEKHLWWWHLKRPLTNTLPWVCSQCWQELFSFHKFYLKIEKVHKQYELDQAPKKCYILENKNNTKELSIVEEIQIFNSSLTTLTEDLVPSCTYKREKKKNPSENPEHMQICELPTLVFKNQDDFSTTDDSQKYKLEPISNEIRSYMNNDTVDNIWESHISLDNSNRSNDSLKFHNTKRKARKKTNLKQSTDSKNWNTLAKLETTKKNDEYLSQSDYKLFCHICNIMLADFLKLKTHYRIEHKISGYTMCCNKKFYNRGPLADHLRVHENPNYFKCPTCNKILAHRISFENHLEFHKQSNGSRERIFNCDKCDKSFFKKVIYDRHILSHVPYEERKFQCKECDKKFAAEYLATQHRAFAHLNKYGKICDICGKSFRERFSFMRHMDEHNGAPPSKVPCDICGVELTSKYLLNRHKKKMHTEENQQEKVCQYCSKISPNKHANRQHIYYAHTMERKHACHMCNKKFKRPFELKEHLSTHTGEPLYTCPHCPRTFISSANMHKHRKASHPIEWQEAKLKKLTNTKLKELCKKHINSNSNINVTETA